MFFIFILFLSRAVVEVAAWNLRPVLATTILVSSSTISPFGNIPEALHAILDNVEAVTCTLDEQNSDESHSSCQLLNDVVRIRANKIFTIKQAWGDSASTGASIWQGANMATWFLENQLGRNEIAGKNIIELGAGVGFTSLVANALGAKDVVITDGNEDVLKLADQNILINVNNDNKNSIRTARLRWNTDDEIAFKTQQWDYIIASDVTYKKAFWPDLIGTIARLSSTSSVAILSMEPRNVGEVEGVLAEVEKQGFVWEEKQLPVDRDKTMCGMTCARLFVLTKAPPPQSVISSL